MGELLAGIFIPVHPPGVVLWPYYFWGAYIPVGAFLYARWPGRPMFVVGYGWLAGAWFAWPIFDDPRAVLAGKISIDAIAMKVGLFALVMSWLCACALALGRRAFRSNERPMV